MTSYIVVSFYTKDTGYEDYAKRMIESLELHDIRHNVEGILNLGNWYANTGFKALYIREMLDKYRRDPIVWIDCDAIVRRKPVLFDDLGCDLGAHFRNWRLNSNELLTGTLYIANNAVMREICDSWIVENARNPITWEQKNLQAVVDRSYGLRIYGLPAEYCKIFDQQMGGDNPVIEHFQASRQLKQRVVQ